MSSRPPPPPLMKSPHGLDPAHEPELARLGDVRTMLDGALQRARAVDDASVFGGVLERSLAEALRHVYEALAATGDWRTFRHAITKAKAHLTAAEAYLGALPSEDESANTILSAIGESAAALSRLGLDMGEALSLPSEDRGEVWVPATRGVPRLIDLRRTVVRPAVPMDAPKTEVGREVKILPKTRPKTLPELRVLSGKTDDMLARLASGPRPRAPEPEPAPPAFDEDALVRERFGVAISDRQLMAERARDYLDDLSMLGRMRRPAELEAWAAGEDCEERMLAKIDAIVACGVEAFPELVRALDDRPLPDPELTFGNVLFFGCLAGDDAFEQARRLIEVSDLSDPEMFTMVTDALVIAPHPKIDEHLPSWLDRADADRRALAAEVLRRRGTWSRAMAEAGSSDPDERVLASAVRALRLAGAPRSGLLGYALQHRSELVVRAALETAMSLRNDAGYERALELVRSGRGEWADAAMFVAIGGAKDGADALLDAAARGHSGPLRALGWYGDASFVPFLLGRLEAGDEPTKHAAVDALQRITGASLTEAEPARRYGTRDFPFRRARRDVEPVEMLSLDHEHWRAWWTEHGSLARPDERYRWGHRYSVADTRWELTHEEFPYRDRPFAAVELAWHRGGTPPDWLAWVSVQRAQLGAPS